MQQCQPSSRSYKLSQLLGGKKGDVEVLSAVFVFFICAHVFLFRFPSRFDLHSSSPSGFCTSFLHACEPDIKGIWGPPHTALYQSGIPLCALDTPPKHFLPLTPLWLQLQINSGTLLSLMRLHNIALKNGNEAVAT